MNDSNTLTAENLNELPDRPLAATANPAHMIATWLTILAVMVAALILWGGLVRILGSGLSIPEWPIVNSGSLLPPFSSADWNTVYHTYYRDVLGVGDPEHQGGMIMSTFQRMFLTEWTHRFLAAMVSIVFIAIMIKAARSREVWPKVRKRLWIAAAVLLCQAILGGLVVKFDLRAYAVALHLGTGFIFFFSLILWTAMELVTKERQTSPSPPINGGERLRLRSAGWAATHTVLLQIVTGGLMAGTQAGLMLNTWPKMGSYWIPPANLMWADWYTPGILNLVQNPVFIQFIHRWLAVAAAVVVVMLIVKLIGMPLTLRGRIALRAVATILALQILLGIGTLVMKVPPAMAFAHLATGFLLFVTLLVITHEAAYEPPHARA